MKFVFEQRIQTLAENACLPSHNSFEESGIFFSHWDFNLRDGWKGDAWLARSEIESATFREATKIFFDRLSRAVRRIAFISQTYTEILAQPWLGTREGSSVGFFRYTKDVAAVGLMFLEAEAKALHILMGDGDVPEEFFFYWNDAVNSHGYSAKLLLMFSALEALVKSPSGKNDPLKLERILGKALKKDLFGIKGDTQNALRNRLVHGEYFSIPDGDTNFVQRVHVAVLEYFNRELLKSDLLRIGIVNPQRHFFGNREETHLYITPTSGLPLNLRSVLGEFAEKGIYQLREYEAVLDTDAQSAFLNERPLAASGP